MKTEDLFRRLLVIEFGLTDSEAERYFRRFRKNFRNIPAVLGSLDAPVVSSDGRELSDAELMDVEIDYTAGIRPLIAMIADRIALFDQEIVSQILYANTALSNIRSSLCGENQLVDVFLEIHRFAVHLANAHKLHQKQISIPPIGWLPDDGDNLGPVRELRNHLEHFEERLEAWFYLNAGKPYLDCIVFDNSTQGLNVDQCLRALNIQTEEYYVLGEVYSLLKLQACLEHLSKQSKLVLEAASKAL